MHSILLGAVFEDCNSKLLSLFHGTLSVHTQIFKRFSVTRKLGLFLNIFEDSCNFQTALPFRQLSCATLHFKQLNILRGTNCFALRKRKSCNPNRLEINAIEKFLGRHLQNIVGETYARFYVLIIFLPLKSVF